jgi:hypothetical protein
MTQETYDRRANEPTGWVGWIFFAGTMMIIGGLLNAFYGFVAALNDDWVVWQNSTAVYLDLTGWGWLHVVLGLVIVLCGIGVFTGNVVARTVGVILAGLSMLANFFVIPLYPIWSIVIITIDALVIWALTAHGGEVRAT